jgi:hypothetical protein
VYMDDETIRQASRGAPRGAAHAGRVAQTLIGKSESEATAAAELVGLTVRVARRDDKSFMGHRDLRPSRVNLTIENGIVTAVSVG